MLRRKQILNCPVDFGKHFKMHTLKFLCNFLLYNFDDFYTFLCKLKFLKSVFMQIFKKATDVTSFR